MVNAARSLMPSRPKSTPVHRCFFTNYTETRHGKKERRDGQNEVETYEDTAIEAKTTIAIHLQLNANLLKKIVACLVEGHATEEDERGRRVRGGLE
jgi:hypothetical protein